jgi:hypothetical protein
MTHDELLVRLMVLDADESEQTRLSKTTQALRAVVEYHKPYESKNYGLLCRGCDEDPDYPCGTILAIEKELQ